jgi:hypothetical protein
MTLITFFFLQKINILINILGNYFMLIELRLLIFWLHEIIYFEPYLSPSF